MNWFEHRVHRTVVYNDKGTQCFVKHRSDTLNSVSMRK